MVRSAAADKSGNLWLATCSDDVLEFNSNGIVTSIKNYSKQVSDKFKLFQNYPNSFNPATVISYQIPATSYVTLKVYDVLGREIAALVNREEAAGTSSVEFNEEDL